MSSLISRSSSYLSNINLNGFDENPDIREQEQVELGVIDQSPSFNNSLHLMKKTIKEWLKQNNPVLQKKGNDQVIDVCYGYIQNQTYEIAKAADLSKKNNKSKGQLHKKVKFSKKQIIHSPPLFTQDQIYFIVQTTKNKLHIHFVDHFRNSDQKKLIEDEVNLLNSKTTKATQTFHNLVEFGAIN